MKKLRILGALLAAFVACAALAQTYPTSNPAYIPNAALAPQAMTTSTTSTPFTVQGVGTLTLRLTTASAVTATVEATNDPSSGSQNWSTLAVYPVGGTGQPQRAIAATGLFKINAAGYSQVRLNVSALTGTLNVRWLGAPRDFTFSPATIDLNAISTLTSQAAATVNSSDIQNLFGRGVWCSFLQSATSGNPSTTYAIQGKTPHGEYVSLLTSAAVTSATSSTAPTTLTMFPGAPATSNVAANMQLPATWRIQTVVGGSATPIATGSIGCTVLN